MKLTLVAFVVCAVADDRLENTYLHPIAVKAAAAGRFLTPPRFSAPVATLRFNNDNSGDGAHRFEYESDNYIHREESRQLRNAASSQRVNVVHGSYSFIAPDGVTYTVNYVADENGFRASGEHLPTPPPEPNSIPKALEINAAAAGRTGHRPDGASSQYLAPSKYQY